MATTSRYRARHRVYSYTFRVGRKAEDKGKPRRPRRVEKRNTKTVGYNA